MTADEAEALLNRHWPEFTGQARQQLGSFLVYLLPRSPRARRRPELCARSHESFASALLDLAAWSAPTFPCQERDCPLCGRD
jgi:hypothetical protein